MPTIKDKIRFNFDGVWSDTYKLLNVVLDGSMFEETFVASREIIETKTRGNSKPLLHSIEDSPIEFDMVIAFEDGFTDVKIDSIIRWLFVDHYRPLYFEGKENRLYMALIVGEPQIIHNGLNQGYFTVHVRCDSSNVYSPTTTTNTVSVIGTSTLSIQNNSHFDIYPEISIIKKGAGVVTIESLDDGGNIFEVRNLTNLEDIYINCEKEIIETDAIGVYRYDDVIGEFPRLVYGENRFKITGDCDIQFRYKGKYRF